MDTNELRRKRAGLVQQARDLLKRAESENRDLSAEEVKQYDAIMADVDKLADQIQREERQQALERELAQPQREPIRPEPADGQPDNRAKPTSTKEYRTAFAQALRVGPRNVTPDESRALQAGQGTIGGYLVAPQQMVMDLIRAVDDAVFIRQLATTFRLEKAESLGAPELTANPSDADWTAEIKTGNEDNTMGFGKRDLHPHPLAKRIKVSNKLLGVAAIDVEALVRDRLAYKFAITHEKAFMTGSGAQQPLGIFTASNQGISTARDVSTGNTTTSIGADGLIEAKHTLKPQYWQRARWIFHRDAIKQIRKLKDGDGNYLWQPGLSNGTPDRILEVPYFISEYAPNTFTTGLYVGIIGDFKFYWIADALDMQVQVLDQLYAETNQTGFIGRLETDGAPVLEEAFVRVKLA